MISQLQMSETVYLAPADLHSHPLLFCGIRFRCLHSSLNVLFACLSWVRTYCRRRLSPSTELKKVACTNLEAYLPKFQGPVLGNMNAIVTSKRLHISIINVKANVLSRITRDISLISKQSTVNIWIRWLVEVAEKMLRQVERERESAAHVWFHSGMHGFIQEFVHSGDTVYQKSRNNRSEASTLFERTAARSSSNPLAAFHSSRFMIPWFS